MSSILVLADRPADRELLTTVLRYANYGVHPVATVQEALRVARDERPDRLAEERPGEVKVVRVNVDEAPSLAQRYRALSIPTLVRTISSEVRASVKAQLPSPAIRAVA